MTSTNLQVELKSSYDAERDAMSLLSQSEKDDFGALISSVGFKMTDFELHETEDPPQGVIYTVQGRVSIRRKSTGAVREYRAGHMSAWLPDFDRDLRAGAFGRA